MINGQRTTDHGLLNMYCLECSQMISWRKEHLVGDNGYYNWRIVASCGCGELTDPEILAAARAAYDSASIDDIFNMQESAMERVIGLEGQAFFNSAFNGSHPSVVSRRSSEFPHA